MSVQSAKTSTRVILDCFIAHKAIDENHSISYEQIIVQMPDQVKHIILNDFIKDQLVHVKDDGTMWFDKKRWDRLVKELGNKYLLILAGPLILISGLMYILNLI